MIYINNKNNFTFNLDEMKHNIINNNNNTERYHDIDTYFDISNNFANLNKYRHDTVCSRCNQRESR